MERFGFVKNKENMEYQVKVTIMDRGYVVEDEDRHEACNDGKELINCLSRIKKVAETDFSAED